MIKGKRICDVCGLSFDRDGKRTVCSATCFQFRQKFIYNGVKQDKKCRICDTPITDSTKRVLCSPECSHKAVMKQQREAYVRYRRKHKDTRKKLRRIKITNPDGK